MEEFEKIDWLPNVEDIIDDEFVNGERLKNEGAMYKILNGIFTDPFQDIRTRDFASDKNSPQNHKDSPKNHKNQNAKSRSYKSNMNTSTQGSNHAVISNKPAEKKRRGRPKKKL